MTGRRKRMFAGASVVCTVLAAVALATDRPPPGVERPPRRTPSVAGSTSDVRIDRTQRTTVITPVPRQRTPSSRVSATPRPSGGVFPLGWYDSLERRSALEPIADDGMSAVMPYHTPAADPGAYLDAARTAGVRVLLEIPRDLVKRLDRTRVAEFVTRYAAHDAVYGWYLADEPSRNPDLGPLSPDGAKYLYEAIKTADPAHPVAIAFSWQEDPGRYRDAMDVLMLADYPCSHDRPHFHGFPRWAERLAEAAEVARPEEAFLPVIQGYGEADSDELVDISRDLRSCTSAEQRYMVFSAVQSGANGLFFWARYRADDAWIDAVLDPIVHLLDEMEPALAAGRVDRVVSTDRPDVRATAFRDPVFDETYIVAIHHGDGTVGARLELEGPLRDATSATVISSDPPRNVDLSGATIEQSLGSFEVKLYRIR